MSKSVRYLEIGPGENHIQGFETLNIIPGPNIDYVGDATKRLPFKDNTFDLIYCSHILEHVPWYQTEATLREWVRVIRPGGRLEVWVPDAYKICNVLIAAENNQIETIPDNWNVGNPSNNPYVWVSGRLFWGANPNYPSWHKSLFSLNYLTLLFGSISLTNIRKLESEEIRGFDHGWINLGITGVKDA